MSDLYIMLGFASLGASGAFILFAFDQKSDAIYRIILAALSMLLWFTNANLTISMYPTYYVLGLLYYFVSVLFLLFTVYEAFLFLNKSREGAEWWKLGKP